MNIKEHVQFFVLMIPTLLLLTAAIVTLASPTANAGAHEAPSAASQARQALAVVETQLNAAGTR